MAPSDPCPCGRLDPRRRPLAWVDCCGRYVDHFDHAPAPDAESLMRSRYSAFVLQRSDYLLATWHPDTRPATLDFEPAPRWLGLEVRGHRPEGERAQVEFVARYREQGRAVRLHERSRFVRETRPEADGPGLPRWYYVDGEFPAGRSS